MDDDQLATLAQQGDMDAFNRLVLAHQDLAFNIAYRITGDPHAAEDATQTAVIKAWRNLNKFRGGSFKAWLMRIVTNTCYDELRRRKRRPTVPLEPLNQDNEEIESPHWLEDPGETPEQTSERAALSRAIQDCLDRLSDDFRTAIILIDIQGMDYAEASEIVAKPLGTIKSRVARARGRLRTCLQLAGELLPAAFRFEEETPA